MRYYLLQEVVEVSEAGLEVVDTPVEVALEDLDSNHCHHMEEEEEIQRKLRKIQRQVLRR